MDTDNIFGGDLLLESGTNEFQLVEFLLRGQSFGVNVDKIQQIINKPEITSIPEDFPLLNGLFDYRDEVIPLIDMRKCLNFKGNMLEPDEEIQKTIVMNFNSVKNGFLVDDVKRLHRISWRHIEPPDMAMQSGANLYTIGYIKFEDRICAMIDFEKILSTINPELSIKHLPKIEFKKERENKIIIFADDSHYVRIEIEEILTGAGFKVIPFENGQMVLDFLEDSLKKCEEQKVGIEKFVNMVLTDIEMPQVDGRYLTRKIKENPKLKHLPVFLFTSMTGMWNHVKATAIGANGIIGKPEIHKVISHLDKNAL